LAPSRERVAAAVRRVPLVGEKSELCPAFVLSVRLVPLSP